jgi:signal transduction histidine kinase
VDGSVLVGYGWQEICTLYHRVNAVSAERCRESDEHVKRELAKAGPCEYTCRNGLRDIGVPILVAGEHLATLFLGQFFYEGETPDRAFFVRQAEELGFEPTGYLAALDRVPVFSRAVVENVLAYNTALARVISQLAEAALRSKRAEEELREANRAKDEFLGMLSHELRNPLAPIRNALHILDRAPPGGPQALRAQEIAGRQLSHLTRLVDDLLDVTRIARGRTELRLGTVDLSALAARTGDDHQALMLQRGLELTVETPGEPAWVEGDETRLAQIIGNLLQNAAKFTPEGGRVALSVALAGDEVEVRVRDTGLGIEPDLLSRVFAPFVQAKQSLARTDGGLGLGLALVKGLVEAHRGSVSVASAGPGQGAEFTVRIPLRAPAAAGRSRDGAAASCDARE